MIQSIRPAPDPARLWLTAALILVLGLATPERAPAQGLSREEAARFLKEVRRMAGAAAPGPEALPDGTRSLRLPHGHGHSIGGFRRPDGGFTLSCTDDLSQLERFLLRPGQARTDAQGRELE